MIGVTAHHRALEEWDAALRAPLALTRRIGFVALWPGSGTSTTAREVEAALARRRSGGVEVSDLGRCAPRALVPAGPQPHAVCLVSRAEPAYAQAALDLAAAYAGSLVLALVEVEPVGPVLRHRLRRAAPVPTVLVPHEPALRLAERHRPSRMPYAYRIAHLRLAAALMGVGR